MKKISTVLLLACAATVFAQERAAGGSREEFWVCPVAETIMFTSSGTAFGGGAAIGYGSRTAIGIKASYFLDMDGLSTVELNFLFRYYFLDRSSFFGPFIQFAGGPALFAPDKGSIALPAESGSVSAGLYFGWRFLFNGNYFIEPAIRAGYPYMAGAGISAGMYF